ncbi:MAG: (Fe-S)-binding protein [Pseudomonadota bacterium]
MFFNICLVIALLVFGLGLIYKISIWFRYSLDTDIPKLGPLTRLRAAAKGGLLSIFSARIITLLKTFFLDVLLQVRILRESRLRWFMHMAVYGGFMLLLLMHALEKVLTANIFAEYYSTLNPFLFLRNLFGLLVIVGLVVSLYRRCILKVPHLFTNSMDIYSIVILAVIMLSGIFLEGTKIVSHSSYKDMVKEYADSDDKEKLRSLESYWVSKYGVVSPVVKGPFEEKALAQGKELHEMSCAACHSRSEWAFMSYGVAKAIKPAALRLDQARLPLILWYVHFLACFIGLAYLPFSKMFHIIASPLSLLVNAVMEKGKSDPANVVTKEVMELDACTRCKTCSLWCSVVASIDAVDNRNLLPSERIESLKSIMAKKEISPSELGEIWKGTYRCTLCGRCKEVCPVNIGLRDLWKDMRGHLAGKGFHPPILQIVKEAVGNQHNPLDYDNEERAMWVEFMDDPPEDLFMREEAEVVYFTGCVSSFSPAVQKIPEEFCQILTRAGVDFTILGEKEWCCGFPLLSAGIKDGVDELKEHNINAIRETGATTMVFSCPSCLHTWSHEYAADVGNIRLMHATQFLEELIRTGKIKLGGHLTGTVTYHDPCDLGRSSGVYAAPREVIRSIPGLRFIELSESGRKSLCCGGGGDVEMYDNELTAKVGLRRAGQIRDSGAAICTTACQQCVRTLTSGIRVLNAEVEVLDVIQLVWRAMNIAPKLKPL